MDRDIHMLYIANREVFDLDIRIPRRYIRDAGNPMEMFTDLEFKKRYRFRKDIVRDILLPMVADQEPVTNRGLPISSLISLLLTLRFYATGSFQLVYGDLRGVSQSTVSRVITKITRKISSQSRRYIKFPENLQEVQRQFRSIAQFPGVSGCIDCTHIPIINPGGLNAELFRNRKRAFSINVQITAGPNLEIFDIVARYPGSYHDSHIFNRSSLKGKLQRRELPGYLLGDAGYPCLPYLLTPFREPHNPGERRYNQAHIQTRNTVERTFGVLKQLFPCLSRRLGNKVTTSCYIVIACAVLHNIAILHREVPQLEEFEDNNDIPALPFHGVNGDLGALMRANVVRHHFQ